jgi:hypothetical protein
MYPDALWLLSSYDWGKLPVQRAKARENHFVGHLPVRKRVHRVPHTLCVLSDSAFGSYRFCIADESQEASYPRECLSWSSVRWVPQCRVVVLYALAKRYGDDRGDGFLDGEWSCCHLHFLVPSDLATLVYLSLATILLPCLIMLVTQRSISAITAAFFSVVEPLVGASFAFFSAGERLPILAYIGGGIVLVGIVLQVIAGMGKKELVPV